MYRERAEPFLDTVRLRFLKDVTDKEGKLWKEGTWARFGNDIGTRKDIQALCYAGIATDFIAKALHTLGVDRSKHDLLVKHIRNVKAGAPTRCRVCDDSVFDQGLACCTVCRERLKKDSVELRDCGERGAGLFALARESGGVLSAGWEVSYSRSLGDDNIWLTSKGAPEGSDSADVKVHYKGNDYICRPSLPYDWGKYCNHSCKPNMGFMVQVDRVFLYALRDIEDGEELTWRYDCEHPSRTCLCGEKGCKNKY